jgi:hypothetical protein
MEKFSNYKQSELTGQIIKKATEIEIGLLINFGENIKIVRRVMSNEKKIALCNYKRT